MSEPLDIYGLKDQVGWRLNKRDKQNLAVLIMCRQERNITVLMRALLEEAAEAGREQLYALVERMSAEEEAKEREGAIRG